MEEVDLAKVADCTIGGGDFYTLKGALRGLPHHASYRSDARHRCVGKEPPRSSH